MLNPTQRSTEKAVGEKIASLLPFIGWLTCFYSFWIGLILYGGYWAIAKAHWPIAAAMALGSYVAGSTPMGGGTVGFPVLVLFFELPGALGRNFGLAIQSIGMVSASILIISTRQKVDWRLLRPAVVGSLVGTPIGIIMIAPLISDMWIKMSFGVLWASFGIMHLIKLRALVAEHESNERWRCHDWPIGLSIGIVGGVLASITGVGIDMLIYAVLMLLYRADMKVAIPTSVILMAITSLVGIAVISSLARLFPQTYQIDPEVFYNWLAAAPVVAIGAPLGAVIVRLISRTPTLLVVSLLCIAQLIWALVQEKIQGTALILVLISVTASVIVFLLLFRLGEAKNKPAENI